MNKIEFVSALAKNGNMSKVDAAKVTDIFLSTLTQALADGEKINFFGFGTFSVKTHGAHIGRNPRTGEEIKVGETKAPVFKAGKNLRERISQ